VGENGGLNLTGFVLNNAISQVDGLGQRRIETDSKGFHVHDKINGKKVSYEIATGSDGLPQLVALGGHEDEFNLERAKMSFQKKLAEPGGLENLRKLNASAFETYPVGTRTTGRTLKNLKRLGKAGGAASAMLFIANATSTSAGAAELAQSYGKNTRLGNIEYADLDAIDIAILAQEATGNYFISYEVLDLLLQ